MWIKDIRDYILYEDRDILVCHKPAGIAVQNARVGSMDLESLLKNYVAQKVPGKMPYLGIIHRLDQPVEGVLVFALNSRAAAELNRQMTSGKIKKIYLAVTEGEVKVQKATLEDWLKKDNRTNSSTVVAAGTAGAKKAVLSYELLETREVQGQVGITWNHSMTMATAISEKAKFTSENRTFCTGKTKRCTLTFLRSDDA